MRVVPLNPWLDSQCRAYQAATPECQERLRADAMAAMLAAHPFALTLLSSGGRRERDAAWPARRAACEQAAGSPGESLAAPTRDRAGLAGAMKASARRRGASVTVLHEAAGTAD